MPKKAKKSVGQSTAKVKKHRLSNSDTHNSSIENMKSEYRTETTTEEMSHFGMTTEEEIR